MEELVRKVGNIMNIPDNVHDIYQNIHSDGLFSHFVYITEVVTLDD